MEMARKDYQVLIKACYLRGGLLEYAEYFIMFIFDLFSCVD